MDALIQRNGEVCDFLTEAEKDVDTEIKLRDIPPPFKRKTFNLGGRLQDHRMLKRFYVTYVRQSQR
mgnify:CR=1